MTTQRSTAAPAAAHLPDTRSASGGMGHMAQLVREAIPAVHPGGKPIIAGFAATTVALRVGLQIAGWKRSARFLGRLGLGATAGTALFFRQPERVTPSDTSLIVSPADGIVSLMTQAAPPPETGLGDQPRTRVSVFLSLMDVHVQFAPVSGEITAAHYHPGKFLSADLDKASDVNERNSLVIDSGAAQPVVVTQIAGLIARRIVCDVAAGDQLQAGQVYGLIRFGSRLDTYLPEGARVAVQLGQRAVGGETVLARMGER